jgi:hypothetical protein
MRYKIDNRPVIFFWSVKSTWMINMDGNLSKILAYIKTQCQQTFGFVPYIIVFKTWFERDFSLTPAAADAAHNWFSAAGGTSYTLWQHNNVKTGVCVPSFVKPAEPNNGVLEPGMGTTDMGKRLKAGLDATVGAGASVTLVEGFTDSAEGAALWRSTDEGKYIYYNYANQRLNILRHYTKNPYPDNLKMEAEACDFFSDLTIGNSGGAFLDSGDLDVVKCTDAPGGWNITNTQASEWMEWRELPLLAKSKFQLRYKSSSAASIVISVDGTALSTINLTNTNDVWTTINAGEYNNPVNSLHTVRLTVVTGTPDINYFTRNRASVATGLQSQSNFGKTVNIYPNPLNTNNLYVDLTGFDNSAFVQVKIMTISGQTVYQKYLNNTNHMEINTLNLLKKSVYLISVESGQTKIVKKLIVNE